MVDQQPLFPEDISDLQRSADISDCGMYRWTLTRRWREGDLIICWVMLNPSTADAEKDDPTIKRVIDFSKRWGFDACVIVNLYPFRSSHPLEARSWAVSGGRREEEFKNRRILMQTARESLQIICAWGNEEWAQERGRLVAKRLEQTENAVFCLGVNTNGSPKHPMARGKTRVKDDQLPVRYSEEQS